MRTSTFGRKYSVHHNRRGDRRQFYLCISFSHTCMCVWVRWWRVYVRIDVCCHQKCSVSPQPRQFVRYPLFTCCSKHLCVPFFTREQHMARHYSTHTSKYKGNPSLRGEIQYHFGCQKINGSMKYQNKIEYCWRINSIIYIKNMKLILMSSHKD